MVTSKNPTNFIIDGDYAYGRIDKDKMVKIDKESLPLVEGHLWRLSECGYAESRYKVTDKTRRVFMHRLIMGVDGKDWRKSIIDHKDMDKLNNTKENLRFCTNTENQIHRMTRKDNRSGFTGVYPEGNKWFIKICGKRIKGTFATKNDAFMERKRLINQNFAEFSPFDVRSGGINAGVRWDDRG